MLSAPSKVSHQSFVCRDGIADQISTSIWIHGTVSGWIASSSCVDDRSLATGLLVSCKTLSGLHVTYIFMVHCIFLDRLAPVDASQLSRVRCFLVHSLAPLVHSPFSRRNNWDVNTLSSRRSAQLRSLDYRRPSADSSAQSRSCA